MALKMTKLVLSALLFSLVTSLPLFCDTESVRPVISEPRHREPNWRFRILEMHPDGSAKTALFFAPRPGSTELPMKKVTYYSNGAPETETDLLADESTAIRWDGDLESARLIPHGVSVTRYPGGVTKRLEFYNKGVLHGPVRSFHPNGQPSRLEVWKEGHLHGMAESFNAEGVKTEDALYEAGKLNGNLVTYYESGGKASSLPYQGGVLEGVALEWHESGVLKASKRYRDGQLHDDARNSAVTLYDEDQKVVETQGFREGKPEGLHARYYGDGKVAFKVSYVDGLREGPEQHFFPDGALKGGGEWRAGVPVGKHWLKATPDVLAYSALYDGEGNTVEPVQTFYPDGSRRAQYGRRGDQFHGEYLEWYPSGELKARYNYARGQMDGEQREYYENGQLRVRTCFVDGLRQGRHEEWYENGQQALAGNADRGERDGRVLQWYPSGQQMREEHWDRGVVVGEAREWHENGQLKFAIGHKEGLRDGLYQEWNREGLLVCRVEYKQGQPHGSFQAWHDNGQVSLSVEMVDGKKNGLEQRFYPDGSKRGVATYVDDRPHGAVIGWFENGSVQFEQHFDHGVPVGEHSESYGPPQFDTVRLARVMHFKDGKLDGEQRAYDPSGTLQAVVSYKDGVFHGRKATCNASGELVEECTYDRGNLEGRLFHRDEQGREVVYHYRNHLRHGPHEVTYPPSEKHGKVKAYEANFFEDKLDGKVREYSEEGVLTAETTYRMGLKDGPACLYDKEGRLVMTVAFKDDMRSGEAIQYFPNQRVHKQVSFVNDLKEGEEKTYFLNGELNSLYLYRDGELDGLCREWNERGVLIFEAEYKGGLRHGVFNKYYDDGSPRVLQTYVQDKLNGRKQSYDREGQVTEVVYEMGHRKRS